MNCGKPQGHHFVDLLTGKFKKSTCSRLNHMRALFKVLMTISLMRVALWIFGHVKDAFKYGSEQEQTSPIFVEQGKGFQVVE